MADHDHHGDHSDHSDDDHDDHVEEGHSDHEHHSEDDHHDEEHDHDEESHAHSDEDHDHLVDDEHVHNHPEEEHPVHSEPHQVLTKCDRCNMIAPIEKDIWFPYPTHGDFINETHYLCDMCLNMLSGITITGHHSKEVALHIIVEHDLEDVHHAIEDNDESILPLIKNKLKFVHKDGLREAARHNCLWCVKGMVEGGLEAHENTALDAAYHGHTKIIQYFIDINSPAISAPLLTEAAKAGQASVVTMLLNANCPKTSRAINAAAVSGHINIIQQLIMAGTPYNHMAVRKAAEANQLPTLNFLLSININPDNDLIADIASFGFTDIVQALYETGANLDARARQNATTYNHPATLAYLDSIGAP